MIGIYKSFVPYNFLLQWFEVKFFKCLAHLYFLFCVSYH